VTRDELRALVLTHQAPLLRYLRYLGADSQTAEDLVQDTFLAAFKSSNPPASREPTAEAGWLRGIGRNLFLMHCRRQRANPVRTSPVALQAAEHLWVGEFLRGGDGFDYVTALRACLAVLSERKRDAIERRYAKRQSRAAMAAALSVSEDGVKSLLRRIRTMLGDCVRERLIAEER
jgi:RNA polymerase sigma-70 factor (ECF subfamily)